MTLTSDERIRDAYTAPAHIPGYLDPQLCYAAWLGAVARGDRRVAREHAYDLFYWLSHLGPAPAWTPEAQASFYMWCLAEKPWLPQYLGPEWV